MKHLSYCIFDVFSLLRASQRDIFLLQNRRSWFQHEEKKQKVRICDVHLEWSTNANPPKKETNFVVLDDELYDWDSVLTAQIKNKLQKEKMLPQLRKLKISLSEELLNSRLQHTAHEYRTYSSVNKSLMFPGLEGEGQNFNAKCTSCPNLH